MSALPPITDVGRRIQVSIWLSVYEYTPLLKEKLAMDLTFWTPRMLSVLRIVTGLLFLEHGTGKLLGFPPSDHAAPTLLSLIGVQGALELVGGFLILIGLFTRPVAFVLAGDMAVAYFMAHAPKSFFPTLNGGQLAILFCFVFLYLAVAGGGKWSADELLARSRAQ
jgi:putative oxidoreductase